MAYGDSVYKHLVKYSGKTLSFSQLTTDWLEGFKKYLHRDAISRTGQKLSRNSHYSYFNKVVAALNLATKERFLPENPATFVQRFKEPESQREFLTLEELRKLVKTDCDNPVLKQAFLFSALTGLRWSDLHKLTWSEVQFTDAHGWWIRFTQKKTQAVETLPISNQARDLLGDRGNSTEPVFAKLKYGTAKNLKLALWMLRAGITKKITFHCARHTYATLQLTFGVDIYTVSKLLGHRNISTTTIYAKVIDQKKIEAANKIPSLL